MPSPGKWTNEAEHDLLFAMILGKEGGEKTRYNWPAVHDVMNACGHTFTKEAISQRFTKFMVKDFKAKYPDAAAASPKSPVKDGAPATPKKGASAKKLTTPRKRGKSAAKKDEDDQDESSGDSDADIPAMPTKKPKTVTDEE